MSKLRVSADWSTAGRYDLPRDIWRVSHPFASRIDSGSAGAVVSVASSRFPAMESAAARNHVSYSLLANTTWTFRSLRVVAARWRISGARWRGHSSSASSSIRIRPSRPAWCAPIARTVRALRPCAEIGRAERGSGCGLQAQCRAQLLRLGAGSGSARLLPRHGPPRSQRPSSSLSWRRRTGAVGGAKTVPDRVEVGSTAGVPPR